MSDTNEPSYRVIIERSAWRQLMRLDDKTQDKVADAIYLLEKEPRPSGCKKLKGAQFSYRIRVGDFRVLYEIHDEILVVLVVTIGDRKEVYD